MLHVSFSRVYNKGQRSFAALAAPRLTGEFIILLLTEQKKVRGSCRYLIKSRRPSIAASNGTLADNSSVQGGGVGKVTHQ